MRRDRIRRRLKQVYAHFSQRIEVFFGDDRFGGRCLSFLIVRLRFERSNIRLFWFDNFFKLFIRL